MFQDRSRPTEFILKAVNSVLEQSYDRIELIVIDDGSKDKSMKLLSTIIDPRFRLVSQPNQGAHNAINTGLKMAQGDYLAILNSDDIYYPNRIEEIIKIFKENKSIALISTWIDVINSEGKSINIKRGWENLHPWKITKPKLKYKGSNEYSLNLLLSNFVSTTSNIVMKKELYKKIGGMRNLRFCHDWDYLLRAASQEECYLLKKPLLKYRVHSSNTIKSNRKWMLFEICWVIAVNIDRFEGRLFFGTNNLKELILQIELLFESVNLQGNDKLFWIIRSFINSQNKHGVKSPEEILLNDEVLRKKLISYIK